GEAAPPFRPAPPVLRISFAGGSCYYSGFRFALAADDMLPIQVPKNSDDKKEQRQQRVEVEVLVYQQRNGKSVADIQPNPIFDFTLRQQPHPGPRRGAHPSIPYGYGGVCKLK